MTGTVVVGVGNLDRGDDAVGLEVARRVRARNPRGARVVEASGEPATLLESWSGAERVILVDAASGSGLPGTVRRVDLGRGAVPLPALASSTHAFGVAEAVELARALGRLPARVIVYAVEGRGFAPGRRLSAEVEASVPVVVADVLADLEGSG